jgi:cytoskeleton protein RodZ
VSLRQIANITRISVMSLEALERSDLSRLPGGIFTRAFVRAYAQEVGLDPDRTIQEFIAELPAETAAATAHPAAMEDGEALESDRTAFTTAMKLIMVSLPIAGFMIYYGMHRPSPVRTPPPGSPATTGTDTPAASAAPRLETPVPAAAAALPPTQPAVSGLTLDMVTKADCFVSVTVDGERVFSGLMHAGDTRKVSAHDEISLSVGDAGAFAYVLNGKEGRPLGAPGEVVSKRITLADSKDYVTP